MARLAVIDSSKARYLYLVCGHYSTLETDEAYSIWRPRKGVTLCENCQDWVEIAKPPAPVDLGNTPMF
jgi:hypothetical protein